MNINKKLLETIFESKIKEFMSIDSKTLYIKWHLDKEDIEKGITKHFYIYYSELIAEIKEWALKYNYCIVSGINNDVLKYSKKEKEYYENFYICNVTDINNKIVFSKVSSFEIDSVLKCGDEVLKSIEKI